MPALPSPPLPLPQGTASIALGNVSVTATGNPYLTGVAAITFGNLDISATGLIPVTSAVALGALYISASGSVTKKEPDPSLQAISGIATWTKLHGSNWPGAGVMRVGH